MPDLSPTRLRSRRGLLFTVLPAIVVLAVLGAVLAVTHHRSAVKDRRAETEALAVGAATNARRFVDDQLATLATAAAAPGVRQGDLRVIRRYLPEVARAGRFTAGVAYADRSLRVRASSLAPQPGGRPVTLRTRRYARTALRSGRATVSDVLIGLRTGAPVLAFAQPIMD